MDILIRSALIVNPLSAFHLQKKDILIKNGIIDCISENIQYFEKKETREINIDNLHVSAGWFDLKANFGDPGFEQKEDVFTGISAASAGGFTGVLLMPSTNPLVQSKSGIEYLLNKGHGKIVDIFPSGTVTVDREGKDLAEMYDMKQSGAVAFTEDKRTISNSGLMLRALQYAMQIDSMIISFSEDKSIAGNSSVNESLNTTVLGFKGVPSLAEEIIVERDLALCAYTNSRLHISLVSTANTVNLIRAAKKNGIHVTSDVSCYHLFLDDANLGSFDSNFKTKPPLRSRLDIEALIEGLKDGTIDAIVSDHSPEETESKVVEFDYAAIGMISLETAFSVAFMALHRVMSLSQIIEKFTIGRTLLGLKRIVIAEKEKANLTLFNPLEEWVYNRELIRSKSKNSPFIGEKLLGKIIGTINNGITDIK